MQSEGLEKWKAEARASQQNYSNLLNDRVWEQYDITNEKNLLWKKIAYVVAGCKEEYNKEEKESVDELLEKCIKYGKKDDHVFIAFLFVIAYENKDPGIHVPLIRVIKNDGKVSEDSYFIDHVGRVYNDWANFLNENIFDRWWLCVPKKGIYSDTEEVELEFHDQTERGKTLQAIDTASTVSNVATSIAMLTGTIMSFTPLAPLGAALVTGSAILGTPGAVYGTGRSISKLVNRGKHDQSINVMNAEARGCWIATVAGVLSFGNMASTTLLARSAAGGNIVRAGVRTFCTSLNVTTISVNGIGILNSVFDVASKKQEDITALDILQLTTSIFFFTNSLVNFKTANEIVKDAQKVTIDNLRNKLTDETSKKGFDDALRNTKKQTGKMHGSADFIRAVNHIENKQEFFEVLGAGGSVKAKFNRAGLVNINNNKLIIHPKAFMQINETQRTEILNQSTELLNKKISVNQFNKNVQSITKQNKLMFENRRKATAEKVQSNLKNVDINGNKIFSNLKPYEIDRLDNVLQNEGNNYSEKYIRIAVEFAKLVKCENPMDFCEVFQFIVRQINEEVQNYRDANPDPTREANVSVVDFYLKQVYEKYIDLSNGMIAEIKAKFVQLQDASQKGNKISEVNSINKLDVFPTIDCNNPLAIDKYFTIAKEITSQHISTENSIITEDNSSVWVTYYDHVNEDVFVVRFEVLADGKSVIATFIYNERIVSTTLIEKENN
jgi:hypothetical protein